MQILPSMTVSTLTLYDVKQSMWPWGLLNCFQGIGKGTLQLSPRHLNVLVQNRCPRQSIISLAGCVCPSLWLGKRVQLCRQSLASSSCLPVTAGTGCNAKYAPVAIRAAAVLGLQVGCDCSDHVGQHQLIDTWCSVDLCDLCLLWMVLYQNCQQIRADNNSASTSITAA